MNYINLMEYIIAFSQLILFVIFFFTLKCELSKQYSDSFIFVSVRTLIMCSSAIAFFLLFEKTYHNIIFLSTVFVPILSGILYITLELISPSSTRCKKEDYDRFTMESYKQQESNIKF
jgi:hypothetical protein